MKKSFILFFLSILTMVFLGFGLGETVKAADEEVTLKGKVVVHYMNWETEPKEVGIHVWDNGSSAQETSPYLANEEQDDFGYVMEVNVMSDAKDKIGIIVIKDKVLTDPWNYKDSGDIIVDVTSIKDGTTDRIDVYYFSGGSPNYFIANPEKANVFGLYYDPTGTYEDKLGVHAWGFDDLGDVTWGTPLKLFKDGFKSPGDTQGKVAHLVYTPGEDVDPGFLIYAGGDENKKHASFGDIKEETIPGFSKLEAGDVKVVFVSGGKVYDDASKKVEFMENAFTFAFQEFQVNGLSGTFAKNPYTIFSRFTLALKTKEVVGTDILELIDFKNFFTLKEGDKVIPIKAIYFNESAEEVNEFVIELGEEHKLDNTKTYTLIFNNGKEGKELYEDEIVLDLDKEAPVINLLDQEGDEPVVVNIELGQEWNNDLFPSYRVTDNRDANLTAKVYVPAEGGYLSTKKAGTYEITLQVEDEWGNVGTATFQIVVAPRKGCKNNSASIFVGLSILGLGLFLVRRRRFV